MELFLRKTDLKGVEDGKDFAVIWKGDVVGRICVAQRLGGFAWHYHITVQHPIPAYGNGTADNLDQAKELFRVAFERFVVEHGWA